MNALRIALLITTIVSARAEIADPEAYLRDWALKDERSLLVDLPAAERSQLLEFAKKWRGGAERPWFPLRQEECEFLLGDPSVRDKVVQRFREEAVSDGFATTQYLLNSSKDPEIIARVADLLWREEGGTNEPDLRLGNAAYKSATVIRQVAVKVMDFDPSVRVWVDSLNSTADSVALGLLRDWWKANEKVFREKRYADVKPGAKPPEDPQDARIAAAPTPTPPGPENSPQKQTPQSTTQANVTSRSESPAWLLWTGGALALVAAVTTLILWGRKSR